jgi:hypothetical protein
VLDNTSYPTQWSAIIVSYARPSLDIIGKQLAKTQNWNIVFILYTYWHSAIHLLLYVFPSIPQTGFRSLVHLHSFSILQGHSPSHEIWA